MKAFLAALMVLMAVSAAAYVGLNQLERSSSDVYSTNSVRLN